MPPLLWRSFMSLSPPTKLNTSDLDGHVSYGTVTALAVREWRDSTPPGFKIAIKGHKYITHMVIGWGEAWVGLWTFLAITGGAMLGGGAGWGLAVIALMSVTGAPTIRPHLKGCHAHGCLGCGVRCCLQLGGSRVLTE
jgi:hypothetical protein